MKYKKFIIKGYRGISDVTEIDISKESLIPIIGKNESGKTTCLEAINAFDFANDENSDGKHLSNVENLYSTVETPIIIAAEISIDETYDFTESFKPYFDVIQKEFLEEHPKGEFDLANITNEDQFSNVEFVTAYKALKHTIAQTKSLLIERDLKQRKYVLPVLGNDINIEFQNSLAESLVKALPYILYFDDFRDRIEEKVYITEIETDAKYSKWIRYIDELFKQSNSQYSVFALSTKQDSIRRSILAEVEEHLNKILTEEWSKYQFEKSETIQIRIEYADMGQGPFLQFKIMEIVELNGRRVERYFDISDRSKGFFWYFNFMIKLHFNPSKRDNGDVDTIYLLDEPGSYLHTYALDKLAEQLKRLSIKNKVIYCTHFHNLLNPEFIAINSIRIAEKINQGKIILKRIDEHETLIRPKRNSAFQPVLDALEIRPMIEYDFDNVVLVEGIYDFYSFKMFTSGKLAYFPCVSASSIVNQIPYMIFLGKRYLAMWDNDSEGRSRMAKAKEQFGEIESEKFLLLNSVANNDHTRLEEYFEKSEIELFNSDHLHILDSSLYRTIINLFYSENRLSLIEKYFPKTHSNFSEMEGILLKRINEQLPAQMVS